MGQPNSLTVILGKTKRRTEGSETSQYLEEKKSTEISSVAASERERAQKLVWFKWNVVGTTGVEGETPVHGRAILMSESRAGHEKSCLKMGGPSSKAKYYLTTDSEPVP